MSRRASLLATLAKYHAAAAFEEWNDGYKDVMLCPSCARARAEDRELDDDELPHEFRPVFQADIDQDYAESGEHTRCEDCPIGRDKLESDRAEGLRYDLRRMTPWEMGYER